MKITFITGAANGLGTEFARLYANDNNNLLLVDKDEQGLCQVQQELQEKYPQLVVDTFVADLSKTEELKRAYNYTVEKGYFVNNLVNGAGFGDRCDFKDMDIDKQLDMTNVNCNAVLYFTRVFLDNMLAHNEGHIINVASIAAFMPAPYMCTYHATKSFVLLLGEAISYEIRKTNVKLLTALKTMPHVVDYLCKEGAEIDGFLVERKSELSILSLNLTGDFPQRLAKFSLVTDK